MGWVSTADMEERSGLVKTYANGPGASPSALTWFSTQAHSGAIVNEQTAMGLSAVFQACRVIAEAIGTLPLHVYRRSQGEERQLATDHPVYALLHDQPNPEAPASIVRTGSIFEILLRGNSFWEISRDEDDTPLALWPLYHAPVTPWRTNEDELYYRCQPPVGGTVDLPAKNVLHFRGLGIDGFLGLSVLQYARESFGLGMALERYGARFFGNGGRPSILLEHPGRLSEEGRIRLRTGWEKLHGGLDNAQRTAVLEEGMRVSNFSVPPDDAQFLESRRFNIEEIARWFGLPLSRLRVQGATAFANMEDDAIDFTTNTLRPHLVRIEQELNSKLLGPGPYFAEHSVEGLLRGNIQGRYAAYSIGRNGGWLSVNDIRDLENMKRIPGGDAYLQPLNMGAIGQTPPIPAPPPAASSPVALASPPAA